MYYLICFFWLNYCTSHTHTLNLHLALRNYASLSLHHIQPNFHLFNFYSTSYCLSSFLLEEAKPINSLHVNSLRDEPIDLLCLLFQSKRISYTSQLLKYLHNPHIQCRCHHLSSHSHISCTSPLHPPNACQLGTWHMQYQNCTFQRCTRCTVSTH